MRINNDFPDPQVSDLQIGNYSNIIKIVIKILYYSPTNYQTIIRLRNSATLEGSLHYVLGGE